MLSETFIVFLQVQKTIRTLGFASNRNSNSSESRMLTNSSEGNYTLASEYATKFLCGLKQVVSACVQNTKLSKLYCFANTSVNLREWNAYVFTDSLCPTRLAKYCKTTGFLRLIVCD